MPSKGTEKIRKACDEVRLKHDAENLRIELYLVTKSIINSVIFIFVFYNIITSQARCLESFVRLFDLNDQQYGVHGLICCEEQSQF